MVYLTDQKQANKKNVLREFTYFPLPAQPILGWLGVSLSLSQSGCMSYDKYDTVP